METRDLRQQILSADDLGFKDVEVPEWGVTIRVVGFNGTQRANIIASALKGDAAIFAAYPQIVMDSLRNPENDEPVFEKADRDSVAAKNGHILEYLGDIAMALGKVVVTPTAAGSSESAVDEAGKD